MSTKLRNVKVISMLFVPVFFMIFINLSIVFATTSISGYVKSSTHNNIGNNLVSVNEPVSYYVKITGLSSISGYTLLLGLSYKSNTLNVPIDVSTCHKTSTFYICSGIIDSGFTSAGIYNAKYELKHGNSLFASSLPFEIEVDGAAPRISLNVNPTYMSSNSKVHISYSVNDILSQSSIGCSGISSIKLINNGNVVESFQGTGSVSSCQVSHNNIIVPGSKIQSSGNLCLNATDYTGHSSQQCVKITVDNNAPIIDTNSFSIVDNNGDNLKFVKPNTFYHGISASVDIKDSMKLNPENVKLKLLENIFHASSCVFKNGNNHCIWRNIHFKSKSSNFDLNPIITAENKVGLSSSQEVSYQIIVDSKAPDPKSITVPGVDNPINGVNYINSKGVFLVHYFELSGIKTNTAFVNVDYNNYHQSIKASNCNSNKIYSNDWVCRFKLNTKNINDNSIITISTAPVTDIVGNTNSKSLTQKFILKKVPPKLILLNITNSMGQVAYTNDIASFKDGDSLNITALINSTFSINGALNMSLFFPDNPIVQGDCIRISNDIVRCQFTTPPLMEIGSRKIVFYFRDELNNTLKIHKTIDIFKNTNTIGNFYFSIDSIQNSPSCIDPSITPNLNEQIFYEIDLKKISPQYNLFYAFTSNSMCHGNIPLQSISVYQSPSQDGATLFLTAELYPFSVNLSKKYVEVCNVSLSARLGNSVTIKPQMLTLKLKLPICKSSQAMAGDIVKNKIDNELDSFGLWIYSFDYQWEPTYNLVRGLCSLGINLTDISSSFNKIETVFEASVKTPLNDYSLGLGDMIDNLLNGVYILFSTVGSGFVKYVCPFATCNYSKKYFIKPINKELSGITIPPGIGVHISEDPFSSLPSSLAGLCAPGMFLNMKKYAIISIDHLECINASISSGMPVSLCDQEERYLDCKFILDQCGTILNGTLVDLLKRVKLGDLFNSQDLIANVIASEVNKVCAPKGNPAICRNIQNLGEFIDQVNDLHRFFINAQNFMGMIQNGGMLPENPTNNVDYRSFICNLAKEYNKQMPNNLCS